MKRPISKQLTLIFTGIFAAMILVMIITNVLLLKNFFTMSKSRTLSVAYKQINDSAAKQLPDSKDFLLDFRLICEKYTITGAIFDAKDYRILSYHGNSELISRINNSPNDSYTYGNVIRIIKMNTNYVIREIEDSTSNTRYIELLGDLENGEKLLLRGSMAGIINTVRTFNFFIILASVIALIVGIIAIQIASRRVSRPVRELTEISEKMTNLDFEAKYSGKTNGEIDRLGENMNQLSEKLESTIGELKNANTQLKLDIEKKEKVESFQRDFIANASHELKTPIALIQGYAEGLKENVNEDPENRAFYCNVIMDEAAKMNELVRQLMHLNELEMGGGTLHFERFNLSEMISNQIQTMSLPAANNGITIEYNPQDIYVWSDEFKVEGVFRNYLSNAINHAKGNKKIKISALTKEEVVRIEVFNTGDTIPEDVLPKLWDKFYKVDRARTREYGGSGVGLSIVKATMELLGHDYGCINMEDGVCFYFELPVK